MPVTIVDITSGQIRKWLAYLEAVARALGFPPELASIFPRNFSFDFSRIRLSVQLSEERLRYVDARLRERERAAGRWTDAEQAGLQHYTRRSAQEYEEQARRPVVRDWEQVRGDLYNPYVRRAIILGDPGFGKSWLLRYEGCKLALDEIARLQRSQAGTADVIVPIFARLSRLAEKEGPLLSRLKQVLAEQELPSVEELWELIMEKARCGQALLLLDGWDEVRQGREQLQEALEAFVQSYPHCRLYLTSRIAGYVPLHLSAQEWELVSFPPQQIEAFVHNYFGVPAQRKGGSHAILDKQAEKGLALLRTLRQSPQVMGLAHIPLMLALLCRLYWEKEVLPDRRVEIYDQCLWGLMWRWPREDKGDPVEAEARARYKFSLLAKLALKLFENSPQADAWDLEELTEWVRKVPEGPQLIDQAAHCIAEIVRDGILVREGDSDRAPLRFLHLTFQEYLAARALTRSNSWQREVDQWLTGFWEPRAPVIELLAGALDDASPLVELLLAHDDPRPLEKAVRSWRLGKEVLRRGGQGRDPFGNMLFLAARCVAEAREVKQSCVEEIHKRASRKLRDKYQRERATRTLVWLGEKWPHVFDTFLQALQDANSGVRVTAAHALGQLGDSRALEPLLEVYVHEKDREVRGVAIWALGWLGGSRVENLFRTIAMPRPILPWYKQMDLDDNDEWERRIVAYMLSCFGRSPTLESVFKALRSDDRWYIAGHLQYERRLDPLLRALYSERPFVRRAAARRLGELGDEGAIDPLIKALYDDVQVREEAAEALGKLGDSKAVKPLLEVLHCNHEGVRRAAAWALGQLGDGQAVWPLVQVVDDRYGWLARDAAAEALEKIDRRMREETEKLES